MADETPPVSYIELNMGNYDEDDVAQLNEWGIWASDRIEDLEDQLTKKQKAIQKAIQQAYEALYPQAD